MSYPEYRTSKPALIDQSADDDLSAAVKMYDGLTAVAVITDANFDAADLTFQGSVDGTNYFPIYDESTQYKITGAAASKAYTLKSDVFWPYRWIKVVSSAHQGDDTTLTVVMG